MEREGRRSFRAGSTLMMAFVPGCGAATGARERAVCSVEKDGSGMVPVGDWREFRARSIQAEGGVVGEDCRDGRRSWAHEVSTIEPGTCLFASASHKWSKSMRHRDKVIILITKASATEYAGIMLNRYIRHTVHDISSFEARVGKEFMNNEVFLGGDHSSGTIEMLHMAPPEICPGAEELCPKLYRGGFNASRELVQKEVYKPSSFRFFIGYTRWKAEELHAEIRKKVWHKIACSVDFILRNGGDELWQEGMTLVGLPTENPSLGQM
eukprot:Plantae.Rhodophyta-Purpureofilum_apyrenoidigerum.ctg26733.p1 GENE.Plantae.Rhodophyta-Purpureofilum_apyrenoidigerum.ctg26733~~Plantae.Rhodophyta-Purpureofilum_apyrenoidigerum.ctg26733.p1  ORF type:complete len:267 (+),score=40.25 Plantae.Rhodophyta-Purpureofilum_apyrenoidigerum.ctg26733:184-984(+)